jgi:tRNA(Ile)-lysidine synthase
MRCRSDLNQSSPDGLFKLPAPLSLTFSMSLLERFLADLTSLNLGPGPVIVAVSGGPDSVALLDLLARAGANQGLDLVVGHVDHGIHPNSAQVAHQVESLASHYGVPMEATRLGLGSDAGETRARSARYAWLEAIRVRYCAVAIMTGHHADDQAETVLMRVLAGSGPAGVAGMARVNGRLVRPLLSFRRVELTSYLRQRGLTAFLDPANADSRHLRSWLRTEVLPGLERRLPDLHRNLIRVSTQAARDRAAWDAILDTLPGLDLQRDSAVISVAGSTIAGYDSNLGEAVLLALARRVGCVLGPSRVGRVFALLKSGESGEKVPLGGGWSAELSFGRLRLAADQSALNLEPWPLEGDRGERVWGRWRFRWQRGVAPARQDRGGFSAWFTPEPLTVRSWTAGEKLKPLGGSGRRLIVRCFQDERVPRSRRASWPVLAQDDRVIWIPGVCRSDARVPSNGTEALRVDAEYA